MRHLFPGDLILAAGAGAPPVATLAPGAAFSMWSDRAGGSQYTDLMTPDGVTPLTAPGVTPVADSNGLRPSMLGPDTTAGVEVLVMWCETGVGDRFPVYGADELTYVLAQFRTLQATVSGIGTGGGGGLPAGTTLEQIADGATRLAFTLAERQKLQTVAQGATALTIGTTATTAKAGNYSPTPATIGAVRNMGGVDRIWGRVAVQGLPTAAEGAIDGDWALMDAS
jgi:hypothetical protein